MTERDALVSKLRGELERIGLRDTVEKTFRTSILVATAKMVIAGRSKYDIVTMLNQRANQCGKDLLPVVREVYEIVKDVNFNG